MRCLNVWESFIFWGAKSGSLTHATAVKSAIFSDSTVKVPLKYVIWVQAAPVQCGYGTRTRTVRVFSNTNFDAEICFSGSSQISMHGFTYLNTVNHHKPLTPFSWHSFSLTILYSCMLLNSWTKPLLSPTIKLCWNTVF